MCADALCAEIRVGIQKTNIVRSVKMAGGNFLLQAGSLYLQSFSR